jgi:hypothetical protein
MPRDFYQYVEIEGMMIIMEEYSLFDEEISVILIKNIDKMYGNSNRNNNKIMLRFINKKWK